MQLQVPCGWSTYRERMSARCYTILEGENLAVIELDPNWNSMEVRSMGIQSTLIIRSYSQ